MGSRVQYAIKVKKEGFHGSPASWFVPHPIATVIKVINHTRWGRYLITNAIATVVIHAIGRAKVVWRVIKVIRTIGPVVGAVLPIIWAIDPIVRRVIPVIDRLSHGDCGKNY